VTQKTTERFDQKNVRYKCGSSWRELQASLRILKLSHCQRGWIEYCVRLAQGVERIASRICSRHAVVGGTDRLRLGPEPSNSVISRVKKDMLCDVGGRNLLTALARETSQLGLIFLDMRRAGRRSDEIISGDRN